jgi:hypothetical protein
MAYSPPQDGHESSWSQESQGDQSGTPNHPWIGGSSGAQQSYKTTASSSGPVAYSRSWSTDTPTYATQDRPVSYGRSWSDGRPVYAPQQQLSYHGHYQQAVTPEHHVIGNSGSPNPVGGSQDTHGGHHASPQTFMYPYQYVYARRKCRRFTDGVPDKKLLIGLAGTK